MAGHPSSLTEILLNLGRDHYVVVCHLELPVGVALETVPLAFAGGHGLQTMAVGGRKLFAGGTLAPTAFFLCPQLFVGWALRSGRAEVGHRLVLLDDRCLPSSPRFLSCCQQWLPLIFGVLSSSHQCPVSFSRLAPRPDSGFEVEI